MNTDLKAVLRERLDQNYEAFIAQLQEKTTSELIAMAPEITAARMLHEELVGRLRQGRCGVPAPV